MKYHIVVFGCQMNISDSERVATVLDGASYKKTSNISEADLIVIAMCSVRQSAVNKVYGILEKAKKFKKRPIKILTGCVLKKDRKKFLDYFDHVINIKEISKLPEFLKARQRTFRRPWSTCPQRQRGLPAPEKSLLPNDNYLNITPKHSSKFSASIPIMTGCNNFCSYCVVPYVRDREISRPAKNIISEIKSLIKNGYKEIWLLGQNVNSYHGLIRTNGPIIGFADLLRMIDKIPGNFWIRFTSSHPKDFSDEVISAMAECKKVTHYLNLPIQSGDDKILKAMNRHYTVKEYKNKIAKLRKKIPDICLSTDIIVGFPGETKKQFENTAKLMSEIKYDMAYINKYSPRHGTAAAKLKDNVTIIEKKRREKVLNEILKHTALENNRKYIGKEVEILESRTKEYKNIKLKDAKPGEFKKVKITEITPWRLIA